MPLDNSNPLLDLSFMNIDINLVKKMPSLVNSCLLQFPRQSH